MRVGADKRASKQYRTKTSHAQRALSWLSRHAAAALLAALPFAAALSGCSETARVRLDVCGNGVLEAGEDCDGGSGCDASCHYPCDASRSCPAGFGCDEGARVCRVASGALSRRTNVAGANASPRVADFDADGRDDLLLVNGFDGDFSSSSVHYFDSVGQVSTSVELPSARAAACADLSGDSRQDVILGSDAVLGFRATGLRKFSPILSTSRQVSENSQLLSADLDCDGQREVLLMDGGGLSRAKSVQELEPLLDLGDDFVLPSAFAAVGRLPRAGGDCEVLALVPGASDRVSIYGRNASGSEPSGVTRLSSVELNVETSLADLLMFDVNQDGLQDLVMEAFPNGLVSYGVADGSFHSNVESIPAASGDGRTSVLDLGFGNILLATQLDDDAEVDFFFSVAMGAGSTSTLYEAALALDLNRDGLNDVAALSEGGSRIDLYRSLPSGLVSRLSLEVPGTSSLRDVADFDGDGHADLLVSSARTQGAAQRALSVLFPPLMAGETPRLQELAELPDIQAAVAGYLVSEGGVMDGYADVGVLRGTEGPRELGLLQGGADRLLRSPLGGTSPILDALSGGPKTPLLGRFRRPRQRDLAVVHASTEFGDADAALELLSLDETGPVSLGSAKLPFGAPQAEVTVLDLDGDGLDELYYVAYAPGDSGQVGIQELRLARVVLQYDEDSARLDVQVEADFWGSRVLAVSSADVDADGSSDLCVSLEGSIVVQRGASTPAAAEERYEVFLPSFGCPVPIAQTWLQADTDGALELALNCLDLPFGDEELEPQDPFGSTLRIYDVDWRSGSVRVLSEQPGVFGLTLARGDFDGDGVDDVVSVGAETVVLFGEPR